MADIGTCITDVIGGPRDFRSDRSDEFQKRYKNGGILRVGQLYKSRPVYYYVFAVFTTLFYSKLRPTFEPDYSTLEQTSFFQNSFVQKGTYRD